jgi:ubiquitin-conjugating enzyme E2 Z
MLNSLSSTWRGERGEEWSSAQGLESILISIQSLMSSNPYENEPGFEDAKSAEDKAMMAYYVAKVVSSAYHQWVGC